MTDRHQRRRPLLLGDHAQLGEPGRLGQRPPLMSERAERLPLPQPQRPVVTVDRLIRQRPLALGDQGLELVDVAGRRLAPQPVPGTLCRDVTVTQCGP
jgi:hypothetical protein